MCDKYVGWYVECCKSHTYNKINTIQQFHILWHNFMNKVYICLSAFTSSFSFSFSSTPFKYKIFSRSLSTANLICQSSKLISLHDSSTSSARLSCADALFLSQTRCSCLVHRETESGLYLLKLTESRQKPLFGTHKPVTPLPNTSSNIYNRKNYT